MKTATAQFDMIVSNPPYVRREDLESLSPEIRLFEPTSALDGGPDGTDCLVHIILTAHRHLRPSGSLLLEIGYDQKSLLQEVLRRVECYGDAVFIKDYSGHHRVLRIRKKG